MFRILVLDDDHAIIELYRDLLMEEGYDVVLAGPTPDPLRTVERIAPDVIIVDYMFGAAPYGWQVVQQLKQYPPTAQMGIVVCTTAPDVLYAHPGAVARMELELVVKPFLLADLLGAVERALTCCGRLAA